jgi:hypothetical protein
VPPGRGRTVVAVLEPQAKGHYDDYAIGVYAGIVQRLAAAGVRTQFVVVTSPSWASGSADSHAPPRDPRDYAGFLARFAATPGIAGHRVSYEIWNEEDAAEWWAPQPDPAAYARLFLTAAPALRAADPTAQVVLGPTTGNNYAFLEQLYANGIQGAFDAVAVHTDTACLVNGPATFLKAGNRIAPFAFLGFKEMRATMLAHGDDKPIRMTELGWSSSQPEKGDGPRCARGAFAGKKPSGVSPRVQATFLREAYHCLALDPAVESASWFTLRDATAAETSLDELRHYGLLTAGGARKPSWTAFHDLATKGDGLKGACGDFAGPRIAVHLPRTQQAYADSLRIVASATDRGGPRRISFFADGLKIRNFTRKLANGRPVGLTWRGARRLTLGPHVIKVVAVDAQGNQGEATVQVRHVTSAELVASGRTRVTLGRVHCGARRTCTVRGSATNATGAPLPGKVRVEWQWRRRTRWVTLHGGLRNAGTPFTFSQRLRRAGTWRVRVRYVPPVAAPAAASPWHMLRVR